MEGIAEEGAREIMVGEEGTEGISTRVIAITAGQRWGGGVIGTNEAEVEGITEMEEGEITTRVGTGKVDVGPTVDKAEGK